MIRLVKNEPNLSRRRWDVEAAGGRRLGQFYMHPVGGKLEYRVDGQCVMTAKMLGNWAGTMHGADGSTIGIVEKITFQRAGFRSGVVTVAKGADPLLAYAAVASLMSLSG